jgi:hypothetical protein
MCQKEKPQFWMGKKGGANWRLHPLVYIPLKFSLAQNSVGGQIKVIEKENLVERGHIIYCVSPST